MVLLPLVVSDEESVETHPIGDGATDTPRPGAQNNVSVLAPQAGSESRSLNVPFCVNIMAGGRYINSTQVSFTSLSGIESYQVLKKNTAQNRNETPEQTKLHQHDFFELMFVFEGEVEQQIEKGVYHYRAGQACLLNRNTRHYEVLGEDYLLVFFCISKDYLGQLTAYQGGQNSILSDFFTKNYHDDVQYRKDYLDFRPVPANPNGLSARALIEQMVQELLLRQVGYRDMVKALLLRLFATLTDPAAYACEHVVLDSTKEAYLFGKAKALIEASHGRVSRSELEKELHYSGDYLSRIIKKHTGMSFSEYCQRVCIKKASQMLTGTDASINTIVAELGFENRTHFYQLFKKERGMTPLEYRKAQA